MKQENIGKESEITTIRIDAGRQAYQILADGSTTPLLQQGKTDWDRLDRMKDEDIDTSDIPELDATFWKTARIVPAKTKTPTTIRLDAEMLTWFKGQGKGWQTRINSVLQSYYNSHHR